jgi:hypothetical protein
MMVSSKGYYLIFNTNGSRGADRGGLAGEIMGIGRRLRLQQHHNTVRLALIKHLGRNPHTLSSTDTTVLVDVNFHKLFSPDIG